MRTDGLVFRGHIQVDGHKYEQWLDPLAFRKAKLHMLINTIRRRALRKAVPFDLTTEYLLEIFPSDMRCPVLGIPLEWGSRNRDNSPSLDRADPIKGYSQGNVTWMSNIANRIKTNATTAQICAVADYLRKKSTTDAAYQ